MKMQSFTNLEPYEGEAPYLHPVHLTDLRRSGLTDETITAMGITDVNSEDLRLGGVETAYSIPYFDISGRPNGFARWRLFPPRKSSDGHSQKYFQATGTAPQLYLPPLLSWSEIAANPAIPIVITEGEKKAAAGAQRGMATLGIAGVWCWLVKQENRHSAVLPAIDEFIWEGRVVDVVPDSDMWRMDKIQHGLSGFYALGMELAKRGAHMRLVQIPDAGDAKVGLDDWCVAQGLEWKTPWDSLERLEWNDRRLTELRAWWQQWDVKRMTISDACPAPVSLNEPTLPPFPMNLFPPWLENMIQETAEHAETPYELSASVALGVVSACCGKKVEIEPAPGYVEPVNIWIVAALPSGHRKTAVMTRLTRPLRDWDTAESQAAKERLATAESERATLQAAEVSP